MVRLFPLILAFLLCACAGPRPPAPSVPAAEAAEPLDPGIKPLSLEVEEMARQ